MPKKKASKLVLKLSEWKKMGKKVEDFLFWPLNYFPYFLFEEIKKMVCCIFNYPKGRSFFGGNFLYF